MQTGISVPAQADASPVPRRSVGGRSYGVLAALCLFAILDALDQGGMGLVIGRIRSDLGLSNVQASFLLGFASTAVTSLVLIPAGFLVDLYSRRMLLFFTAVMWSTMSFATGMAGGFWSLLFTRSGAAAADGLLKPSSQSMLRDAFPVEKRGLPFSLYWGASALGSGLSFYLSGSLIALADHGRFHTWPIIGHFTTWQIVLALPGLLTLPLAFVMLAVKEPARDRVETDLDQASFRDTINHIRSRWWLYWPSFAYSIVWAIPWAGYVWTPTTIIQEWQVSAPEVGHIIGLLGVSTSILGLLGSGLLIDILTKRGIADVPIRVTIIASVLAAFFQTAILHVHALWLVFSLVGLTLFFQGTINASYYVAIASITPGRFMGRMFALQFLCLSIPGAFAPTMIALIADHGFCCEQGFRMMSAININVGVGSVIYLLLLLLLVFRIGRLRAMQARGAMI